MEKGCVGWRGLDGEKRAWWVDGRGVGGRERVGRGAAGKWERVVWLG